MHLSRSDTYTLMNVKLFLTEPLVQDVVAGSTPGGNYSLQGSVNYDSLVVYRN